MPLSSPCSCTLFFCSQFNNVGCPHLTPLMLTEFLTNSVLTSSTKAALAVHTTTVNNNQIFHTSDVTHCPRGAQSKLQQECCNNFTKIIFTKQYDVSELPRFTFCDVGAAAVTLHRDPLVLSPVNSTSFPRGSCLETLGD